MLRNDTFRIRISGYYCVYCGEPAGTVDHFPPASFGMRGYLLPSCRECNSLAGTAYPCNFERRADFVKAKLKKRYRKHLKLPDWDKPEIQRLGYNLKKGIGIWQQQKEIAKQRCAWNAIAYLTSIDHNNDFVQIFAEEDFSEKVKERSLSRPGK